MKTMSTWIAASFVLVACGSSSGSGTDTPSGANTGGSTPGSGGSSVSTGGAASTGGAPGSGGASSNTGGASPGVGGAPVTTGSGGGPAASDSLPATIAADGTFCAPNLTMGATTTIAAGATATFCAGTTITVAAGASLTVQGTLNVQGTVDKPVRFVGATPQSTAWVGLLLPANGNVVASYLEIHDARVALDARARSNFTIDHILIEDSAQMLNLQSDGTISHGAMHGLGSAQAGSPVLVNSASPHIVDTVINQGLYGGVDLIVIVGANAAPVFDHTEIADSHCGLHISQGAAVTVSNSVVHHNAYAMMLGALTAGVITHNNFQDDSVNLGSCGGTVAAVSANYFAGQPFDSSCQSLAATGSAPAAYTSDVGPRP